MDRFRSSPGFETKDQLLVPFILILLPDLLQHIPMIIVWFPTAHTGRHAIHKTAFPALTGSH